MKPATTRTRRAVTLDSPNRYGRFTDKYNRKIMEAAAISGKILTAFKLEVSIILGNCRLYPRRDCQSSGTGLRRERVYQPSTALAHARGKLRIAREGGHRLRKFFDICRRYDVTVLTVLHKICYTAGSV